MELGRGRDTLVGGDVAGEAARRVGLVVGRPHAQGVAQCRPPARVGEGLLGLQAQAVARHHPHHPLDRAGGEDIAHTVELAARHRGHQTGDLGLVGTERAVAGRGGHAGHHAASAGRSESLLCRAPNLPGYGRPPSGVSELGVLSGPGQTAVASRL